ncbi:hypothetical protein N8I77_012234 [Diaporthe amygdali]|uniref:Uncharacterized protein n=1 Tax=Phomopsis amygdali TaxID=1214568 RepID=A0AAD9S5R5_PHOAM|nr:hypothetical protein N8I77_012234 [Diaporthe amygdali]
MQRTSEPLTNPVLELHDQSRADSPGAQPPWRQSGGRGPISLSNLPRDVILGVLDEIRPVGSLTTSESTAERPVVRPGHLECRASLLNVCLSSRAFYGLAIPHLYRNSLIKDRQELLHFFRTLVKQADRRPMVRSFAWAGVLREADADAGSSIHPLEDEATIATDCWNSIKDEWPRGRVDCDIAKFMGIDGSDTVKDWRLLGAVLAMCPRIRCLFMLNGAVMDPPSGLHPCPELDAVLPFLQQYEFGSSGEILSRARPYGHPFLEDLELLIIEGHSNVAASINTGSILASLFLNSPLLCRVEIKHPPLFREVLHDLQRLVETGPPLMGNIEELSLFRGHQPQDDLAAIVALFPKLVSLCAEFMDGSARPPLKHSLPPEASEALLNVSGTLETLSLTTSPETYPAKGHWVNYESYPSSLSTLNQMAKLKDLTTESIWLFGTEDPAVALQLSHLLPPSLVRLHLIDYWGNSDLAEFYPEFPDGWTPLEFYNQVFQAVCNECQMRLPKLRQVTFTTNRFNSQSQTALSNNGQAQQDETQITQDSMRMVKLLFEQAGVDFHLVS